MTKARLLCKIHKLFLYDETDYSYQATAGPVKKPQDTFKKTSHFSFGILEALFFMKNLKK